MRANHVPRADRLRTRINRLHLRYEAGHVRSPTKGNPYWCCEECGIHDPQLSIQNGQHFHGCRRGGILKEIAHYERLLAEELDASSS
jgi:hypothetical protein